MNERARKEEKMKLLGIDNVFFQVGSLEEALGFYEKMGFELKFKIPHCSAALLQIGTEEPGLMLWENHEPEPSRLWIEVESALQVKEELVEGTLLETATGLTFEVIDPWGNRIGFADYKERPQLARGNTVIRPMMAEDLAKIIERFCFPWSTPAEVTKTWQHYYQEQQSGIRTVGIIEEDNEILGYGSLLRRSKYPYFSHIPEINDVWIDEQHRRRGLGKQLVLWLEELARKEAYQQIVLGVGLYRDYGPAQNLYFHLGYVPDGHGITYKCQPVIPGEKYPIDDDLILWLIKSL